MTMLVLKLWWWGNIKYHWNLVLKAKNKYQQILSQCSCDKKENTVEPKQVEIFEPCVVNLIQPLEESEMLLTTRNFSFLDEERVKLERNKLVGTHCCEKWVWCIYYWSSLYGAWSEKAWWRGKVLSQISLRIGIRLSHLQHWFYPLILLF